jgi:polyhydroxyalkanoate synthesis regulator phasin
MSTLKERMFRLMQDPRVADLMRDPRVQDLAVRAFRFRGRVEGALDKNVQKVAGRLNLATHKDLRALHRRIRHLEQELREAEESLIDAEGPRETPGRS